MDGVVDSCKDWSRRMDLHEERGYSKLRREAKVSRGMDTLQPLHETPGVRQG